MCVYLQWTTKDLKSMQLSPAERETKKTAAKSKHQIEATREFREEWEDVTGTN